MTSGKRSRPRSVRRRDGRLEYLEQRLPLAGDLVAGDGNQDYRFDEADIILAFKAAKYDNGEPASWSEGDWNGAPGGTAGDPPIGDGVFTASDFVAAFVSGAYLTGPYIDDAGETQDELLPVTLEQGHQVRVFYESLTGDLTIDSDEVLSTFHLESMEGVFLGIENPINSPGFGRQLPGLFDVLSNREIFKLEPTGFSHLEFSNDERVIQPGLSEEFLLANLRADGSFLTGGAIGEVSFRCIDCFQGEPASISGAIFEDANRNGIRDEGENGISGVPIRLESIDAGFVRHIESTDQDIDQNGSIDPAAESGRFSFGQLPPGNYRIRFAGDDSEWVATTSPIELGLNEGESAEIDALGVSRILGGNIEVRGFRDDNENGARDAGEPFLNDVRVSLFSGTNIAGVQFTSDRDLNEDGTIDPESETGVVRFDDLRVGEYEILTRLPAQSWTASGPGNRRLSLGEGETVRLEFGFIPLKFGAAMGQVFHDVNSNGVRDDGEVGLNGWTVLFTSERRSNSARTRSIDLNEDGEIDPSSETGIYLASDLVVDTYSVIIVPQPEWISVSPENGRTSIVVTEGDTSIVDFANFRPPRGDFDQNDVLDINDVDLMCATLRGDEYDTTFDLNGDGRLSLADLDELIENEFGTTLGDSNLDGSFDSADLVSISQAGEYEDEIFGNSTWAEGDWNCDGEFDAFDLVRAFRVGGYVRAAVETIDYSDVAVSISRLRDVAARSEEGRWLR